MKQLYIYTVYQDEANAQTLSKSSTTPQLPLATSTVSQTSVAGGVREETIELMCCSIWVQVREGGREEGGREGGEEGGREGGEEGGRKGRREGGREGRREGGEGRREGGEGEGGRGAERREVGGN